MRESATRVLDLVEALLDFRRARRGTLELSSMSSTRGCRCATPCATLDARPGESSCRRWSRCSHSRRCGGIAGGSVRLLVTLVEHVLDRASSDRVEVTVDAVNARVRYRVQETGGLRPGASQDAEACPSAPGRPIVVPPAPATAQLAWGARPGAQRVAAMGGGVSADAAGEGRMAFVLDLPQDGPPPADAGASG